MRKALSLLLTVFLIFLVAFSLAESYEASTMRLLQHSGAVEIFDVSGAPRFLLDNVRFASGESLKTGEDGSASVSLDDTKILTMDFNSWVEFLQEAGHMQLNLLEGSLFLDVQKKLDENESFDIQTTTMTVGIRGTLIFVTDGKAASAAAVDDDCITIGILEGGGRFSFTDPSGAKRVFDASAGQKVTIPKKKNNKEAAPQVSEMSSADVPEYVTKKVLSDETLTNRVTNGSAGGGSLLIPMTLPENALPQGSGFGANDDWLWKSEVTIVAQSASKLYDGVPLMRTSDALVYGLPGNFNISVTAAGSQTDAGTAKNVITSYTITNSAGENVNSHFTNIRTVEGSLVVDPAPLIVWTGSAEKVYDGTPLTCPEAGIRTVPGHTPEDPAWKNSSLVTQTAAGSEKMVAISGSTYVQGTNPLTGETEKIELQAGQSLSVNLHDEGNNQSIEFEIKTLKEEDLPDEVLQIYASNPEMLAQACAQTGWDPEVIKKRIAGIQPAQATTVSGTGLNVTQDAKDSLMTDSTNVRIHIDSDITNYTTRSLTGEEASFIPIKLDSSIVITPTGTQTEVGESENKYTIDWGRANPKNYVLRDDLGTLVVTAPVQDAEVTISAASAEKEYDGTALRNHNYRVSGLPDGYSLRATVSGSITDAGTARNNIASYAITDADGQDVTDQFTNVRKLSGTLTVTPASLTVSTGSGEKVYDGEPLTCEDVTVTGLASGESITVTAKGSVTEPGSATNTCSISWDSAKESNYTLSKNLGTLTVEALSVDIDCGGGSAGYTGSPYIPEPVLTYQNGSHAGDKVYGTRTSTMSGAIRTPRRSASADLRYTFSLFTGDTVELTLSGAGGKDAGTYTITGSVSSTLPGGVNCSYTGQTVTIEPYPVEIDLGGGTYTFGDNLNIIFKCNGDGIEAFVLDAGSYEAGFSLLNDDMLYLTVEDYPVDCLETGSWTAKPDVSFEGNSIKNYAITYVNDTITIDKLTIYVTIPDREKTYNGVAGPDDLDDLLTITGDSNGYLEAYIYQGDYSADVGTYPMTYRKHIDYGYLDSIEVVENLGTLTIVPRDLELDIKGSTVSYGRWLPVAPTLNGETGSGTNPITWDLGGDETITITFENLPDASSDANTYNVSYTAEYSGKESNFNLTAINTTYVINPCPINIVVPNESKPYDGTPITHSHELIPVDGCPDLAYSIPDSNIVDVDEETYAYTLVWNIEMDEHKKDNYLVTMQTGTYTITPVSLTISTAEASKTYDGEPLVSGDPVIEGLVDSETIEVSVTNNSITEPGYVDPEIDIVWGTAKEKNYTVTKTPGRLTVNKIPLVIDLGGGTFTSPPGYLNVTATAFGDTLEPYTTWPGSEYYISWYEFDIAEKYTLQVMIQYPPDQEEMDVYTLNYEAHISDTHGDVTGYFDISATNTEFDKQYQIALGPPPTTDEP